ncbi:MAG: beta-galactosidase [Phycisphaerae bacterium]|nr:beta-galactosidase [Phycisphaerae bacterium]
MWTMLLSACVTLGAFEHRDAFDYPDGTEGEPAWFAETVSWEVRDHAMTAAGGDRTFVLLQNAPHGRRVTVEATVTLERHKGNNWAIAGVAVRRDAGNHWHLALVESPEGKHFVELQEQYDGAWPAVGMPDTKLTATERQGGDFNWQYGRPYRLRIALTPQGISGSVTEMDGTVRGKLAFKFDNKAVTSGQPGLDCGEFVARFDDFVATVDDKLPAPEEPKAATKPYDIKAFDAVRAEATGFFYPKQIDGKWWLIDPKGRGVYLVGTDHASYYVHWCEKLGYAPYHKNMVAQHGSEAAWADETAQRLDAWGFNALPANHSRLLRYRSFAHIEFLAWGTLFSPLDDIVPKTTWTGVPNVFSPKWARNCDKRARRQCAPNRNDPWLIGYFIDNELEWYGKIHRPWGVFVEAWKKPAEHSAKQAWVTFVREKVKDVDTFNKHWGTKLASFDDLAKHTAPTEPACDEAKAVANDFLRLVADRYFKIAAEAIRRHDPNHLVLGCRFAGDAPDIWDVAGKYCDIVSLNTYPRIDVDRGVPPGYIKFLEDCHAKCRRPMMLTEWSFPALDAGLPSKHGAGMRVDTQAQKTKCFEHYQRLLFSLPFMVGSNYFMWADEPAEGISSTFPEDSNYGLVNVKGQPYKLLTEACRRLNARVFELHLAGKVLAAQPRRLRPWFTVDPTAQARVPSTPHEIRVADLRLSFVPGPPQAGEACRIELAGRELGGLTCLIHQQTGQHLWVLADHAKLIKACSDLSGTVIDLELSYIGSAKPMTRVNEQTGQAAHPRQHPHRYKAGWRIRVPAEPGDTPFLASQCLWIENADDEPWDVLEVFHWVAPRVGGDLAGDAPDGPDVPNYYLSASGWADRAAGLGIGATYPVGDDYTCNYWLNKAGGVHSDLRLTVGCRLAPGKRHELSAPPVFVFAYQAKDARSLGKAAGQVLPKVLAPSE